MNRVMDLYSTASGIPIPRENRGHSYFGRKLLLNQVSTRRNSRTRQRPIASFLRLAGRATASTSPSFPRRKRRFGGIAARLSGERRAGLSWQRRRRRPRKRGHLWRGRRRRQRRDGAR